jgi:prepilin-type processing-associated H-X9-DG protein
MAAQIVSGEVRAAWDLFNDNYNKSNVLWADGLFLEIIIDTSAI